ncbi:MAG: Re/Si-specific NAD(P)(+) transhydrogenase subunit alpha [Phycisphaerae bacterium]|nr:Re/Si-specific NAD(P)(+) transhydrogenase subunit alpha [Phycisphaerae bacterium]
MRIYVTKERHSGEARTAMVPENAAKLVKRGAQVAVETGIGDACGYSDADYIAAGATVVQNHQASLSSADMVLRLRKPPVEEIGWLRQGSVHISFLDPFSESELIQKLAAQKVSAVSMEMIPRITRAQKMDALTSQANLAGYVAVILAADHLNRIFPMMTTAAGTIMPAKVFIIGAGVAGLQAIATARRLGANVEAFDTRPVVAEQVQSLGAKFVKIDLGETGQTRDGYAKALTEEQIAKQREGIKKHCAAADVVITTAQVFGKKAPIILTADIVAGMKKGSVIVDLPIESGGNVEGSVINQVVEKNGVKIVALANLSGRVPVPASKVYSTNLLSFIEEFWDKEGKKFVLKLDDEIIKNCLITHNGQVCSQAVKK